MPSLYDVSIPMFIKMLGNLDHLLGKAEDHVASGAIDEAGLTSARLVEDMHPLPRQVQFACDSAKFVAQRVGLAEPLPMPDEEVTIAELRVRIAKTLAYLAAADPAAFEGRDQAEVVLKFPGGEMPFTATDYVIGFAIPNFYFHVTTAYALLRMKGVPIGKMDYMAGAKAPAAG